MTNRVLFVTGEYPPMRGGVGDYTARLVDALADHGWDSAVLTSHAAANNPDHRVLPWITRWDWSMIQQVRRAVVESGAGLVHVQYQTGAFAMHPAVNFLPRFLRRAQPRPAVVTTFHDLLTPYLFPKAGLVRRWVNRALANASDALLVTNPQDRAALGESARLAGKTAIIPVGSNLPHANGHDPVAVRRELDITGQEPVIGFFGFLTVEKGFDLLLDALESMGGHRPRVVVVGGELGDTDVANLTYRNRLRNRLAKTPVSVCATGHLTPDAAARVLATLDLVVLPFRHGASLRNGSLIAAIRSGTPVLTTDPEVDDSLEPLMGGESVWLVPPGDADALRRGIELLLGDPALRRRLASSARSASAAFAWDAIAAQHINLYETVLVDAERPSGPR